MSNDMKMTIEIKNTKPVELIDLTQSLTSIADEYRKFLVTSECSVDPDGVKLYIKEIRGGSIITELQANSPYPLPFIENAATIIQYAEYLKKLYDYLAGRTGKPEKPIDKQTFQNMSNIIEPIAKDNGSQFNIGAITINGDVKVSIHLNSLEANAVQNTVRREIEKLKEPDTGIHEQVLMYLYQARNDISSTTGDKAIIESIHTGPVKTIFIDDKIKAKALSDKSNLFKKAFIVDVSVETIAGVPKLYKVSEIHDIFDRDL